jgi:malonyl-CoA/methylmalonyl-CoA synthetase
MVRRSSIAAKSKACVTSSSLVRRKARINVIDAGVIPDLLGNAGWAIDTSPGTTTSTDLAVLARRYAAGLARLDPGAGVVVGVANPVVSLAAAMGAWWVGLRVAFERADSPLTADDQARVVGASIRVVDGVGASGRGGSGTAVPVVAHADLIGSAIMGNPRCSPDDLALDAISSGTTGMPKCVVFTHSAIVANASALAEAMDIQREDRIWTCLPHGLSGVLCTVTLAAAGRGATAHLSPADSSTSSVAAVRSLRAASPSVVYAVPEVYEAMARTSPPEGDTVRRVRVWLSSSGILAPPLFDAMRQRWGAVVRSFYCGSEIGTATFNDSGSLPVVRASVGRPLDGVSIGIDSRRSGPMSAGAPTIGQVTVRGALTGHGYRTGRGVVPFPSAGVVTTDLGTVDSDGFLYLLGRTDGHIHVGTEIVDPRVVEAHIESMPGVHACEVVPRTHPLLGQVAEARVWRVDGAGTTRREIILGCRDRGLSGGWVPRRITWVGSGSLEETGAAG